VQKSNFLPVFCYRSYFRGELKVNWLLKDIFFAIWSYLKNWQIWSIWSSLIFFFDSIDHQILFALLLVIIDYLFTSRDEKVEFFLGYTLHHRFRLNFVERNAMVAFLVTFDPFWSEYCFWGRRSSIKNCLERKKINL